jgi:hypothetical protein
VHSLTSGGRQGALNSPGTRLVWFAAILHLLHLRTHSLTNAQSSFIQHPPATSQHPSIGGTSRSSRSRRSSRMQQTRQRVGIGLFCRSCCCSCTWSVPVPNRHTVPTCIRYAAPTPHPGYMAACLCGILRYPSLNRERNCWQIYPCFAVTLAPVYMVLLVPCTLTAYCRSYIRICESSPKCSLLPSSSQTPVG